jgi:hypothetical protein
MITKPLPAYFSVITNRYCPTCLTYGARDSESDAFCCRRCDRWLEPLCGDPGCQFCRDRPAKPSLNCRRW